jgi:hypothetical protein
MFLSDLEIRDRFAKKRPGLDLIAVEDAALPVTVLGVQVLAQEEKGLPLLDEFVLRAASAGVHGVGDVAALLGIDTVMLQSPIADQHSAGNLEYSPSVASFALTQRGEIAAKELTSISPVEQEIPVIFDRSTWRVGDYREVDLVKKAEAKSRGMIMLPALSSRRVDVGDVRPRDIEMLIGSSSKGRRTLQILEILRVRPRKYEYLPVKLLVFSDGTTVAPELIVVIDGEDSPIHENQLESIGGAIKLGLRVDPAPEPQSIEVLIEQSAFEQSAVAEEGVVADSSGESESPTVTQISVFDHRLHLHDAVSGAKNRLLIVSPWIKNAVVDTTFIADLERRLRAGVTVQIGHGYGKSDDGSDESALRRLRNLQSRFPDRFTFARLPNTHAKILIYDDTYITTSFNWLSFRGDPERTYRMEEGTLVRGAALATKTYDRYSAVIREAGK